MKYVPPLGATDPNASYQDGNPEAGILGSIVPAAAIERPQREILNVLTAAGLTPSDTDLTQLLPPFGKSSVPKTPSLSACACLKSVVRCIGAVPRSRKASRGSTAIWCCLKTGPSSPPYTTPVVFPVWCCLIMPTAQPLPPTSANSARMPLTPRDYTFLRVANSFSELGRGRGTKPGHPPPIQGGRLRVKLTLIYARMSGSPREF